MTHTPPADKRLRSTQWQAYALLTATAACWGANAVFSRLAVGEISPMSLVLLRWVGVVIIMLALAWQPLRQDWPVLKQHWIYVLAMGSLGFASFNGLFYVAAHSTHALNIGILQGSIPVFVLLGTFLIYRSKVSRLQILGVLVTVVGVLVVASSGQLRRLATLNVNVGDGLMMIACLLYAGYAVGLRRRPQGSSLSLFCLMAGAALLTSIPLVIAEVWMGKFQWPTPTGWVIVALVTLFPSLLAQVCFIRGVQLIGPGRAGVFVNLVPIFATIMAVIILHEQFGLFHAVALGLVLGGIWIAESGKPNQS